MKNGESVLRRRIRDAVNEAYLRGFHDGLSGTARVEAERKRDHDLLMHVDSLLSLLRHREAAGLSQQTIRELDALLPALRRRADDIRSLSS